MQSSNGQPRTQQDERLPQQRDLGAVTPEKFYCGHGHARTRKVVALLADPDWSVDKISQACKVSDHTVRAVRDREHESITERKKTLTSVLVDVATLGAEQMERKIGRASLRDASIATGVSVDKVLALQGQTPVGIQVANIVLPSEAERAERRALHDKLDEITARLKARAERQQTVNT